MVEIGSQKDLKQKNAENCSTKIATDLWIKWFYIPWKKIILLKIIFSHRPVKYSNGLLKCCMSVEPFKTLCVWHWLCTLMHTSHNTFACVSTHLLLSQEIPKVTWA